VSQTVSQQQPPELPVYMGGLHRPSPARAWGELPNGVELLPGRSSAVTAASGGRGRSLEIALPLGHAPRASHRPARKRNRGSERPQLGREPMTEADEEALVAEIREQLVRYRRSGSRLRIAQMCL